MSTFVKFNPLWDTCRSGKAETTYEDHYYELASDFEGGNGCKFKKLGTNHYYLETEPEIGNHLFSGEGYYFCFAIRFKTNTTDDIKIRIYAVGDETTIHRGQFGKITDHCVLVINGEYSQLPHENINKIDMERDIIELTVPKPKDSNVVFVSNFHWWPYTEGTAYFKEFADKNKIKVEQIGTSPQGRAEYAYEFGSSDPNAPRILLAQAMQPSECGHLLIRYAMEFLWSGKQQTNNLIEKFRFYMIPYTCPDASVLGYCVSNAAGDFLYFESHKVALGLPNPPSETIILHHYIEKINPLVFIEVHSNNWGSRKGNMLLRYRHHMIQDAKKQRLWDYLEERYLTLERSIHESWTSEYEGPFQKTIGYFMVKQLQIISLMMKYHDKYEVDVLKQDIQSLITSTCEEIEKWSLEKPISIEV